MTFTATLIADSESPEGSRIITLSLRYPRFILAEFNTHRMLSRNSSSSRAIPIARLIADCEADPVYPVEWGANQKGMQARSLVDVADAAAAKRAWDSARAEACKHAKDMALRGIHKQISNRLIEPFAHTNTVATGTYLTWRNFDVLRNHSDAQPEIRALAQAIKQAILSSVPRLVGPNEWHTPYVPSSVFPVEDRLDCSAARCARVSYKMHDGSEADLGNDLRLASRLRKSGHWSPFEHQATPCSDYTRGNLEGWMQLRHHLEDT